MDEITFWKGAAQYLWTAVAGVGAWFLNKQDGRIKSLEDSMYSKTAARERREEVDKHLEDRRQDVISLHAKIDSRSEKLDDKIDAMAKEMNQGFSDIKNLFIKHIK